MKAQIAKNSVVTESMHHEISQAKTDKAKTEDQVLIRDLQINEAERLFEVMRQAREEAERLVAIERQARKQAERLVAIERQDREQAEAEINELRAALVHQRGKGGNP